MATMASFHNKLMNLEARLRAENEARSKDKLPRDLASNFTSPQHTPRPRLKNREYKQIFPPFVITLFLNRFGLNTRVFFSELCFFFT